jgi:D-arabinose 1-dehydrogenase-like Zn-dependent alcohol dehydrogenase
MRAMQIIEWGKPLEAREYPDPEPKGEEVLLRVEAAGVCHSDVHIWDGYFDLGGDRQISLESRGVHLPFTMGHEIAGEVAALGPQASGVGVGDKVVAYPWIGCGECAVCRKGEELLCLNPRTLGTRCAGGYGTHLIVPHGRYLLPYQGVPQALAATYTCSGIIPDPSDQNLCCGCHCERSAAIPSDSTHSDRDGIASSLHSSR